jgi:dopamine beta-monooxygenase
MVLIVNARKHYQTKIPNGANLPGYPGVGHLNPYGGGERNPFGIDFMNAGFMWTEDLCFMDSDSDGLTNGEELGDPGCIWSEGELPTRVDGLSHPGFANPPPGIRDTCEKNIEYSDHKKLEWRMNKEFIIPTVQTNYFCEPFGAPNDTPYYMYRIDYLIDSETLHHMLVLECETEIKSPDGKYPVDCLKLQDDCITIAGWAPGAERNCYPENTARKISSYKHYYIQYHYNNHGHLSGLRDRSGAVVSLTSTVPKYEIGSLFVGTDFDSIVLPPGKMHHLVSDCPSICTELILPEGGIHLVSALLHGHYRATNLFLEHYNLESNTLSNITVEVPYHYDSQKLVPFTPPIVIKRGDSLRMHCQYNTENDKETIRGGWGTDDEMCLGTIDYYPKINMVSNCFSIVFSDGYHNGKKAYYCGYVFDAESSEMIPGCSDKDHVRLEKSIENIVNLCGETCNEECYSEVNDWINEPCIFSEGLNYFTSHCSAEYKSVCQKISPIIANCPNLCTVGNEREHCRNSEAKCIKNKCTSKILDSSFQLKSLQEGPIHLVLIVTLLLTLLSIGGFMFILKYNIIEQ